MTWSLRERLRQDGRQAHDRVDAAFADFDLTQPEGLGGFLEAHAIALDAMALARTPRDEDREIDPRRPSYDYEAHSNPAELRRLVHSDLAALSDARQRTSACEPHTAKAGVRPNSLRECHPIASDYVLLGSRLGLQVLRRRWQASPYPSVLAAAAYISLPPVSRQWKALCHLLAAKPAEGCEADRVVADAIHIFYLFETAATEVKSSISGERIFV